MIAEEQIWTAIKSKSIDFSGLGDNTVITSISGSFLRVFALFISPSLTVSLRMKNGGTNLTGLISLPASGVISMAVNPNNFLLSIDPGNSFIINASLAVQVSGFVSYWEDPV